MKIKPLLVKSLVIAILALPFLNIFIVSLEIHNGIIDGKTLFYNAVTLITLTFLKSKILFSAFDLAIIAFWGFIVVNYCGKIHFYNDLLIAVTQCIVTYFIFKAVIYRLKKMQIQVFLSIIFLVVSLIESIISGLQLFGVTHSLHPAFQITGTFHNPGILGLYLAVIYAFSLSVWLFNKDDSGPSKILKGLAGSNLIFILILLPSTNSRDAFICTIIITILLVYWRFAKVRATLIKYKFLFVRELGKNDEAEKRFLEAIYMIPNRLYPRYLLAKFYIKNKNIPAAMSVAREIINLPIKINSPATSQIKTEMNQFLNSQN